MASALAELQAGGEFTGGIYGALLSLRAALFQPQTLPSILVACFDDSLPPFRRAILPDYKRRRAERRQLLSPDALAEVRRQIRVCYRLFGLLGIRCLRYRNREADDVVAAAVQVFVADGFTPTVVSSDRDLWQTVAFGARVYDFGRKRWLTEENFERDVGVPVHTYVLYKALVGDASDSISGVPGCGEKRAAPLMGLVREVLPAEPSIQLSVLVAKLSGAKRKFEQAIVTHREAAEKAIRVMDLRASFGRTDALRRRLYEPPSDVRVMEFLRECWAMSFDVLRRDRGKYVEPYKRASERARACCERVANRTRPRDRRLCRVSGLDPCPF